MNKEDILKRAKKDNNGFDERDRMLLNQATAIGYAVGGVLCMIINLISYLVEGIDPLVGTTCWLIYCGMMTATSIFKCIRINKKGYILLTIVYILCFICFVAIFIIRIVNR